MTCKNAIALAALIALAPGVGIICAAVLWAVVSPWILLFRFAGRMIGG